MTDILAPEASVWESWFWRSCLNRAAADRLWAVVTRDLSTRS